MGRKKTIDRDELLDTAELIIRTHGAAGLTIDSLAKAADITKGGVQYTFSSKQAIIDAIMERWFESYTELYTKLAGENPAPTDSLKAHIEATRLEEQPTDAKSAGIMAALLQSPDDLEGSRVWYQERLKVFDLNTDAGRNLRMLFYATEGLFMLKQMRLADVSDKEWDIMLKHILAAAST
ncbi:TetR/AcrR family transcriptional regulator [Aureimonas fodinaquatilis]|uniref:TetR/AcrR family transcriptional regulator n=1 Tax=Aureimonas fodinaquatilis TaxID=2565783 RepID=A0A5B0DUD5_9HYPH|nr:TetR/AcrR family transcriptional regulator [Aureimonas fodinaquatilis]KAA0970384.1 TetR/AcrR family transcriptional regulator [Aureimonas fodinaquatilis]